MVIIISEKKTKTEEILDDLGVKTSTKKENKSEKKLREDFESWYVDIDEISDKGILLVKNALEYKIALTSTKKPKLEKQKSAMFPKNQRKKYEVLGVNLLAIKIADQKEIDKIILEDPTQELRFDQVYKLQLETTYTLKLTEQQYKSMIQFLQFNKIGKNKPFYFSRFGKTMGTYFGFYKNSQVKISTQTQLKK